MGILITEGTAVTVKTTDDGGHIQHVRIDGGTYNAGTATVGSISSIGIINNAGTLANGSLAAVAQVHNAGTLQAGTVQLNPTPIITPLIQGTLGTAGGSLFGTLSAASGAGTKHYISGFQIVVQSGTPDVRILTGTAIQGTGVLAAGAFPPGGGIRADLNPPFTTGTNSEITYHFVGAGTAFIVVNYWKGN